MGVLALAVSLLSGCTAVVGQMTMGRVDRALQERKAPSLHSWSSGSGEPTQTLRAVEVRTGLLLSHWDSISVNTHVKKDGGLTFDVGFSGTGGFISSSVPITEDGYFLTAAHCADNDDLTLVTLNEKLHLVKVPARVVWRGNSVKNGPDLAIIKAAVKPPLPFEIAGAGSLSPNVKVAATGWSGIVHDNPMGATAAGHILSVSPLQSDASGAAWRVIGHDVPLNFGDSGGPLVLQDGRLAGINSCIGVTVSGFLWTTLGFSGSADRPLSGYAGEAFAPSPAWLSRTIENDRKARRSGKSRG